VYCAALREVRNGQLARDISGSSAPAARGDGLRDRGFLPVLGRGGPDHRGTPPAGAQGRACIADRVSAHERQTPRCGADGATAAVAAVVSLSKGDF
jgi:hypothetical protein